MPQASDFDAKLYQISENAQQICNNFAPKTSNIRKSKNKKETSVIHYISVILVRFCFFLLDLLSFVFAYIPWVSISDMKDYGTVVHTKESVSLKATSLLGQRSPRGTLLMSFKLTVGRTAVLDIDAYHNEAIISIWPFLDSNFLQPYLFYTLPVLANLGDSKDAIKGKTLNTSSINNLLIPLPPSEEQSRIVNRIKDLFRHL